MTDTISSSLRSFHIYRNEMEDVSVRFSMKRKREYTAPVFSCEFRENFKKIFFAEHVQMTVSEYSRTEFCVNTAQLIILSYPRTHRERCSLLRFEFGGQPDRK